ncbi:unnamed protein product [Prorocentrum cordatum]|uniref:KIF-binding protein n=1 Tax=Prorocentrum cordatum TaxID=2364126 RepID=A0ABN9VI51_9DINO|nr:unnamed protein product [Polarella glacialis]
MDCWHRRRLRGCRAVRRMGVQGSALDKHRPARAMATNKQLAAHLQALTAEVRRLSEDNVCLRLEAQGGIQAIPALVDAVARLADRPDSSQPARLVDTEGVGKPSVFDGAETKYREWTAKFESFVVGVYGERFRQVLEWSIDRNEAIDRGMWQQAYGQASDDEIGNIDEMVAQVYKAIQQLVTGEPFDTTQNVEKGNGLECWRKRNLLKLVLSPGRCKLEELACALERWEEAAKHYESRKDYSGHRERFSNSARMSALESLLPTELEEHVLLNQSRLNAYELLRREIASYPEAQTGSRLRDAPTLSKQQRGPNTIELVFLFTRCKAEPQARRARPMAKVPRVKAKTGARIAKVVEVLAQVRGPWTTPASRAGAAPAPGTRARTVGVQQPLPRSSPRPSSLPGARRMPAGIRAVGRQQDRWAWATASRRTSSWSPRRACSSSRLRGAVCVSRKAVDEKGWVKLRKCASGSP